MSRDQIHFGFYRMFRMGAVACALTAPVLADNPFATAVVEFDPAPGQFVNNVEYVDPLRALGWPLGDDPTQPDNSSLVSLGGFGGKLTLAFDHTVRDDPANPFGLDAIVYGNALWVAGDQTRRWAECGVIEISRDANSNGLADDDWFVIPGSHLEPGSLPYEVHAWDDDIGDATYPPIIASWIPPGRSGVWTSEGHRLPPATFDHFIIVNTNGASATEEDIWGYADFSPTQTLPDGADAEAFYTRPDNPFVVGMTPGAGGGDAFDIAWAVDAASGQPAGLSGLNFIRIRTAVNEVSFNPPLGELSTEIDAVADVAEGRLGDAENDGDVDIYDFAVLHECLAGPQALTPTSPCRVMDFDQDGDVDLVDCAGFQVAYGAP